MSCVKEKKKNALNEGIENRKNEFSVRKIDCSLALFTKLVANDTATCGRELEQPKLISWEGTCSPLASSSVSPVLLQSTSPVQYA